jgi:hypothetical protein
LAHSILKIGGRESQNLIERTIGSIPQRCDVTKQAKFLFECVQDTINRNIPEEVSYIYKYNEFKRFLDDKFKIPDKLVATIIRFLEQNNGTLSQRAKSKEITLLSDDEVKEIENRFKEIFESQYNNHPLEKSQK